MIVEKEVNQLRLTLAPYRTTIDGVGYNRVMTSFFMVPTRVAIQTSVPLAQRAGPQHSISTGIIVAVVVPVAVLALIVTGLLYLFRRRRRQRRREREGILDDPLPVRLSDDSRSPSLVPGMVTAWNGTAATLAMAENPSRNEKVALALAYEPHRLRNPGVTSTGAEVPVPVGPSTRSMSQRSARSTAKGARTGSPFPPEYHVANANGRYSLSTESQYTSTIVTRRPSQRRVDAVYPTVPVFLDYIGTLPGAERRNITQYAPTFLAQDYYTLDELRGLTQAELCEAIPGLTRGNADYICQMVAQELERIECVYGAAF